MSARAIFTAAALGVLSACGGSSAPQTTPANETASAEPADSSAPTLTPAREPAQEGMTESGIAWEILRPGTGTLHPRPADRIVVHYRGTTSDGEVFDDSHEREGPATFPLSGLIPGWVEALPLMVEGEIRRIVIPEALAYAGRPNRPQGDLTFEIELIEVLPSREAPEDVAAPPANAERCESGLAWVVLRPGEGPRPANEHARVTVHYTGWTTDGEMFDSSRMRGEPATFPLDRVIAGWTEGVQMMQVGELRRLWIPEALAYQGRLGAPQGMLVFDIELLEID